MSETPNADGTIFQVKITLIGVSKPPVWRRVLVPAEIRLDRFHSVIQAVMGWHDYHMHVFSAGPAEYGVADSELGHEDERDTILADLLGQPEDRLRYTYDFGDDWEHEILLEQVLTADPGAAYPSCVAGRSACPPEDCGGVWGYADLREQLADETADRHAEVLQWLELESASEFDPAAFTVEAVNEALGFLSVAG
jgi:hypothetical protein